MATFLRKFVTSIGLQEPQNCGNGVKTLCLAKVSPERAKTASKGPRSKPNLLFAPDLHQSRSSSARMPLPWKTDFLVSSKKFYFVSINSPSQFSSSSPPRSVSVWGQSLLPLQTFRFRKWVSLYNKLYIRSQQIVNLGTNSMADFQQFRDSLVVWPLPPRVTAQKAAKAHYLPYLWQANTWTVPDHHSVRFCDPCSKRCPRPPLSQRQGRQESWEWTSWPLSETRSKQS